MTNDIPINCSETALKLLGNCTLVNIRNEFDEIDQLSLNEVAGWFFFLLLSLYLI